MSKIKKEKHSTHLVTIIHKHERVDLDYFVRGLGEPKLNYLCNVLVGDELIKVTRKERVLRFL